MILKRLQQCDGMESLPFSMINTSISAVKKSNYMINGAMVVNKQVEPDLKGYHGMFFVLNLVLQILKKIVFIYSTNWCW